MKEMRVQAIKDGTVIDHIPSEHTLKVVEMMGKCDEFVAIGINFPSERMGRKGVVKIANQFLTDKEVDCVALVAPNATVNIIRDFQIVEKHTVTMPDELVGVLQCTNPKCITNAEPVTSRFRLVSESEDGLMLKCHYCERVTTSTDVEVRL